MENTVLYYLYHFSKFVMLIELASCVYNLCSHIGPYTQKGRVLCLMPAVVILKFLIFDEGTLECHFALGPVNYIAGAHNSLSAAGENKSISAVTEWRNDKP